jgi:glucose/arabinose dehydrogenase
MPRRSVLAVAVLALLLGAGAASGPRGGEAARTYAFRLIVRGLVEPVYVTSATGDASTLYVVEQRGTIRIVRSGRVAGTFLDISSAVLDEGERGLLSMAFHPDYAHNHLVYVDYTDLHGDTHVVEYRAPDGAADPASARELLFVPQPYPNHKGGQLQFDSHGLLYVGMGDGGTNPNNGPTGIGDPENRAQNPASSLGKLLRIDPTDPASTWQVVAYGLRNPWRFSFDRASGDLWIGDVGAARAEEIDYRAAARVGTLANFGWSRYEGRLSYNPSIALGGGDLVWPSWTFNHAYGQCSVIGGYVYRGSRFPALRGKYFFGDYCNGSIWRMNVGAGGRLSRLAAVGPRVPLLTSFGEDANGELYAVGNRGLYALR